MPRAPIWQAIAETLRTEIAVGHYAPGAKLPTEAALAARFGVNRHTVRHGLAHLAEAGFVHARRGSGVFVAGGSTDYPLGRRVRFHQNVAALGRTPTRQISRLETRRADAAEAEALKLPEGAEVHVVEGLSLADGVAIAAFRSIFPAARFPGLIASLRENPSITLALGAAGVEDYTRASTRLNAKAASATLALQLRLPQGAPILRTIGINVDGAGVPVEYGKTWFVGDRVTLTVAPED